MGYSSQFHGLVIFKVPSTRPSNPHYMQIWRFLKKVQKNLEIGASILEISKICVKLKKNTTDYLFEWFFTFLVPPPSPSPHPGCIFLLFRGRSLRFRRLIKVILQFCFALKFWTTSSHFEICASVRRVSFHRDLSAPMFHWN